jgi:POT family proton-dependent oligopeptide transporter
MARFIVTMMKKKSYLHPKMLYIASFSELWERFSFYIVEALLIVYLIDIKHLPQDDSYTLLGTYLSNSFILTIIGSYFGQNIIGFRSSVNLGALIMASGYALLLHQNLAFLYHGLALIVVGSAFFKPNMACFVGALYKTQKSADYSAAFNIYYACIMIGVILSTSVSGYILEHFGWDVNFLLASICMLLSFFIFILGNKLFYKNTQNRLTTGLMKSKLFSLRWPITFLVCLILWAFLHLALSYRWIGQLEMLLCGFCLFCYFVYTIYALAAANHSPQNFIACIILLFFSGIYWSILFQIFFSFNLMNKLLFERSFLGVTIPLPVFMGVEAFFVIVFSPLLGKLWLTLDSIDIEIGIFFKYALAFTACALGLITFLTALHTTSTPSFYWIILAYAFIGLGEAILAPTALAMIGQLNPPEKTGLMMSALYVFWGFGTKLSDVLASWSVYPAKLQDPYLIAPFFYHALFDYLKITAVIILLSLIAHRVFKTSR